jgi:hypothetical protein
MKEERVVYIETGKGWRFQILLNIGEGGSASGILSVASGAPNDNVYVCVSLSDEERKRLVRALVEGK